MGTIHAAVKKAFYEGSEMSRNNVVVRKDNLQPTGHGAPVAVIQVILHGYTIAARELLSGVCYVSHRGFKTQTTRRYIAELFDLSTDYEGQWCVGYTIVDEGMSRIYT